MVPPVTYEMELYKSDKFFQAISDLPDLIPVTDCEADWMASSVQNQAAQGRILINKTLGGRYCQIWRVIILGFHIDYQLRLRSPSVQVFFLQNEDELMMIPWMLYLGHDGHGELCGRGLVQRPGLSDYSSLTVDGEVFRIEAGLAGDEGVEDLATKTVLVLGLDLVRLDIEDPGTFSTDHSGGVERVTEGRR